MDQQQVARVRALMAFASGSIKPAPLGALNAEDFVDRPHVQGDREGRHFHNMHARSSTMEFILRARVE